MAQRGNPIRCPVCNRFASKLTGYCKAHTPQDPYILEAFKDKSEKEYLSTQTEGAKHVLDPFPQMAGRASAFVPKEFGILKRKWR